MRVGCTLLLSEQKCVQSYKWNKIRALGSLQIAVDSIEEYGIDEIAIIRLIRSKDKIINFIKDLEIIENLKTMTPISFGGGIRTEEHLRLLKNLPIERLIFSSAFIQSDRNIIEKSQALFGSQAILCLLPIKTINNTIFVFNSSLEAFVNIDDLNIKFINDFSNEIILYDIDNEGEENKFDFQLINKLNFDVNKLIISGGIGRDSISLARNKGIASVLVDNKVLHKEFSVNFYKHG